MEIAKLFKATHNKANKSQSSKKTILFVEQNQDGTVGGSHYSLLYMVRALDKKRYDALVMFYEEHDIIDKFAMNGVTPIIYKKPTGKHIAPPHSLLQIPYKLAQKCYNFITVSCIPVFKIAIFMIHNNVDLVHLNNSAHAGWHWLFVSKILGRKCITHQRGIGEFSLLARRIAKYFDTIICISKAVERCMQDNNLYNTEVIYNAIDIEEFRSRVTKNPRSIREELGINLSAPLIGMIANFQEWKGQTVLVKAADLLRKQHPRIICLLIGAIPAKNKEDMDYFKRVEALIDKKDLHKNVIITGFREDVPDLINALDVQLHCSISPEPFGRVLIEGMVLMKPIIATNIGGPCEIIENGVSGLLVPPDDSVVLAETIGQVIRDEKLRHSLGIRALQRVKERFTIENFSKHIDELYTEVLLTCQKK